MRKLILSMGVSLDGFVARLDEPLHLELVEAETYGTGAALHIYRPFATT